MMNKNKIEKNYSVKVFSLLFTIKYPGKLLHHHHH